MRSDLPSRGAVSSWLHDPDRVVAPSLVFDVMAARASGELMTAKEWRAAIDYEAAWLQSDSPYDAMPMIKRIVDAAIGGSDEK